MRTIYPTYEFRGNKDPVLYIAKTVAELYAIEQGLKVNKAIKAIALKARVHPQTPRNWFYGKNRTAKFETLAAFINAAGQTITVAGELCNGRYRPRAVKGKAA